MATAIVGLGSCKGHRHAALSQAVALIARLATPSPLKQSTIIESAPWGYSSDATYLNMCVSFTTELDPVELLRRLQLIEKSIDPSPHRDAEGHYIDRVIDIDLIAVDRCKIDNDFLTLPHPRMHLRPFVIEPMMEIEPELGAELLRMDYDN
ncbi:MAG: 2-amino-4-hydroxy-6-hydroxymethyldihydropteridine diphosphokinase [Lachnoclostridium sp.]|nr:2-amino-4-hydroxy-6-hydroxymethyldihydropteridine diphosphokinase [Lachnoclostridium sp.]